jgi:hypothetical protein
MAKERSKSSLRNEIKDEQEQRVKVDLTAIKAAEAIIKASPC